MLIDPSDANSAESSTADAEAEAAALAAAEVSPDANAAESSTVDDKDAKPVDLLSVVKDAVKKEEPAAAGSSTVEGEGEVQPGEAEPKAITPEEQAEADAKLPFHKHPRWQEVVAQRDSFQEDAGRFREIEGFMQQHGLTGDEMAEGYDIMAKLKSGTPENLTECREWFSNRLAFLDNALGNVLPEDLQARVEAGEIDDAAAREVARLRAADKLRTASDEARQTAAAEEQVGRDRLANATACATAVDAWEKDQRKTDPDYAKKAALVETTCRAIVQETRKSPGNPKEAVELVEKALARVNEQLSSALPTPKPVKRDPQSSSAQVVTAPKTLREAVQASLNAS